ncbi:BZ3500_MvSof-1268-A1-R1_Chr2-3g05352 [Microbotryum saponariae]|uniref:BZ3500_MvSof-1268-A1-R1_Chr2-3g05352 protein n=1 Tax=Microbotryum saponariae TaxID=289078 RepID=A0A2X0M878_9BASI|nr:BZ3500_MvSof-1268-A1-R1_Chr2-3g05352 [Microbotryum saponariae]SDA01256.1 BZ3501_MvSof-1269-A2-R1_Chr2-2g05025 [Microbotryum saponariae]
MGRVRRSRTHSNPKKNQAPGQKTRRYTRDLDQIHDDMKDGGKAKMIDTMQHKDLEDLPGMAQHHCLSCARYFADAVSLATHKMSKPHKRRLKKLQEEPYTIEESRRAAGLGVDKGAFTKRREEAEAAQTAATAGVATAAGTGTKEMQE